MSGTAQRAVVRRVPYSIQFSGSTSQYGKALSVPFANATQVTICGWVKTNSIPAVSSILIESGTSFGSVNGLVVSMPSGCLFVGGFQVAGGISSQIQMTNPLPIGQWVRFCAVIDQSVASNQVSLYVNGIAPPTSRPANGNCTAGIATNDHFFAVRNGGGAALYALDGNLIVDYIVTGKSFTAAEALSEYLTGNQPSGGTTIARYSFNAGSGTTITDTGTGAKNITLTGSPIWVADSPSGGVSGSTRLSLNSAPLNLTNLQLWIRSDSGVTMIGGAASGWADLSGHALRILTQATASKRAVMVVGSSSQPALSFSSASSQYMDYQGAEMAMSQPITVFCVFKYRSLAGNTTYLCDGASPQNSAAFFEVNTPSTGIYSGSTLSVAANYGSGSFAYGMATFNGNSSVIRMNGAQVAAGAAGITAATGFTIASPAGGLINHYADIDVHEYIVMTATPTAGEIAAVESYFQKRYGL